MRSAGAQPGGGRQGALAVRGGKVLHRILQEVRRTGGNNHREVQLGGEVKHRKLNCSISCLRADIVVPEHESSILRSFIQPCMWFLHDGTG